MDTTELTEELSVMETVSTWSPARRFALARRLLYDLERELVPRTHRPTADQARGLLATDQPPPTDEEVKQWLDEERMKKYG